MLAFKRVVIEDGPFGGDGGMGFTDGGQVHLNGPITLIELKTGNVVIGNVVNAITVRYLIFF